MRYVGPCLSREQCDALVDRYEEHHKWQKFAPWVVEIPGMTSFAGVVGLMAPSFKVDFASGVEIKWKMQRNYWGKGYATEAALASLEFAFDDLGLAEVVAFTTPANTRSRALLDRIGMLFQREFEHPNLDPDDKLWHHLFYSLKVEQWGASR